MYILQGNNLYCHFDFSLKLSTIFKKPGNVDFENVLIFNPTLNIQWRKININFVKFIFTHALLTIQMNFQTLIYN